MDQCAGKRQLYRYRCYKTYFRKPEISEEEFSFIGERRIGQSQQYSAPTRKATPELKAISAGLFSQSHDDATVEHVAEAQAQGIAVSLQPPTTHTAAKASKSLGMSVLMGALNVVRGGRILEMFRVNPPG